MVNNKDNRVFMSRNYRYDTCPFEIGCSLISKTSIIFASRANINVFEVADRLTVVVL